MKVALIARSTLYTVRGGDTVQIVQTAQHLLEIGVEANILLSSEQIDYSNYDLLHFFNIIRPADIIYHSKKSGKPFVVSTILCNYSEYDKHHRRGFGLLFSCLPTESIEYIKTMARLLLGKDHLSSISYIWKGQRKSIIEILKNAAVILPNSKSEYNRIEKSYLGNLNNIIVPNGINPDLFKWDSSIQKDEKLVLCVARIEGIKNQINLIKALNNTSYKLLIIGASAPNQINYYNECRRIAADNVTFIDHLPQNELVYYYQLAKVHVLPSWFETTGLSTIEAAIMGCNIVITDKGDTREYFENYASYCDPGEPESILNAVKTAGSVVLNNDLRQKILANYTWKHSAAQTLKAYQSALYYEFKSSNFRDAGYPQPLRWF